MMGLFRVLFCRVLFEFSKCLVPVNESLHINYDYIRPDPLFIVSRKGAKETLLPGQGVVTNEIRGARHPGSHGETGDRGWVPSPCTECFSTHLPFMSWLILFLVKN